MQQILKPLDLNNKIIIIALAAVSSNQKKRKNYAPPRCRSIRLLIEGFICTSTKVNQTNSNEEEWKSEENLIDNTIEI